MHGSKRSCIAKSNSLVGVLRTEQHSTAQHIRFIDSNDVHHFKSSLSLSVFSVYTVLPPLLPNLVFTILTKKIYRKWKRGPRKGPDSLRQSVSWVVPTFLILCLFLTETLSHSLFLSHIIWGLLYSCSFVL